MKLNELKPYYGSKKKRKIVGRGYGSGHGRTATRGSKGQHSRSGTKGLVGFEGGQNPLIRRIPKRGFSHKAYAKTVEAFNLGWLAEQFDGASEITPKDLSAKGYAKHTSFIKVLSEGELKKPVTIKAHAFSKQAIEKITKANGKYEIIKA